MLAKRLLGNTGIEVSVIGLGTVKFGRNQAVKYPETFELPSDSDILKLLDCAKELGINLLDTAPAYGASEERLGKALKESRKEWVIVTKVGEEFIHGKSVHDFSPKHVKTSIERSLKRLNTDYLDVVLVHSDGNDIPIIEQSGILECLSQLKDSGYLRAFGMSTKTVEGGLLAVEHCDVVMVTFNPLQLEKIPVIQKANKLNKGILIKKALASGHLQKIPGENPVETSLNLILSEPGVSSIILGTLKQKHLIQNVKYIHPTN